MFRFKSVKNKVLFQIYISCAFIFSIFFTSCHGPVPDYLRDAKVDISIWTPTIEVVLKKDGLNLVKEIVPLQDSAEFLIMSDNQICRFSNYKLNPNSKSISPELTNLYIVRDTSGEPSYIVGDGLWGKPSAAVFDINGKLKWKKDYPYKAMGLTAVLDDGAERFVVLEKYDDSCLLYLNFESGEIARKGSQSEIIASADFTGDGNHEILVEYGEDNFAILDGVEHELSRLKAPYSFVYHRKQIITSSMPPCLVFSGEDTLAVYDSNLKFSKNFIAIGSPFPMHAVAASYIGNGPDAPFVAVCKGKASWGRSILYVFSATGELVYKEILKGSYQSIASAPQSDGIGFLLGGRNEVLLYSFPQ